MFLMNQWYAAALPRELTDKPTARTICGQAIVMYRAASGQVVALDDRCPHRYAPLSAGTCVGENIRCPYHGIVFDPSGACAIIPHQPTIPQKMRVRAYPLVERWGFAWIWMGDAALADPNKIPPYEWFDSPDWKSFYRYYHVPANYELCADNLLDLSHTPYIHATTIGTPDMDKFPLETWTDGDRVLSRRVMTQVAPGPFVAEWGNFAGKIDRVTNGEWRPACNIAVELFYEDAKTKMTLRLTNPLTPETERTTHIWFAWSRNFGNNDESYVERFERQSSSVQDEDNRLLELQQAVVDRGGPLPTVAIAADTALLAARRAVQRLLREEEALSRKAISWAEISSGSGSIPMQDVAEATRIGQKPSRTPLTRGVHHLVFCTDDMQKTVDFYVDVLGAPLIHAMKVPPGLGTGPNNRGNPPYEECRHYFFDMGNDSILAFFEVPKGVEPPHNRNAVGGAQHVAFVVTATQFAKLEDHLKARSVQYLPAVQQGPGMYGIYFYDPNGIRLEFACQPAQGEQQDIISYFTQTKAQARAELTTLPGATPEWVEKRVAALPD